MDSLDAIASDGFYYLTQSVTLTGTWECNYDVTLCLNGNDIVGKMNDRDITVNRDKPFTLTDCHTDAGKITHEVNYSKNGVSNYGTFYMYNGNISGNTSGVDGGGVYNGSIFNLYGGSISGNKTDTCGGGVANYKTFHMYGGTISGNNASVDGGGIYNNSYATFEMKGSAVISGNTANDGGGVFNYYHVDMYDISSIRDNTAVTGGGVCNTGSSNTADFCMHDNSSITGNTATTHYGGGVYTCAGSFSMENNASITGNSAPDGSGGGVYHSGTYFEMNGGSITGNTAGLACGGGISVNSANSVELKGKVTITGNTAENGKCSNYYQDSDHVIKAANLTEGSLIGIELNYSRLPSEGNPTVFTNEGCNAAYFSSDEPSYTITASGNALALAIAPPQITAQPQDISVEPGSAATFKVSATGIGLTYQWQINQNDGKGFVNITGANQASYTTGVTAKDCNGFKYQCVIRNSAGTVTTKAVTLTVTEKEAATSSSYTILDGANSSWTQNTDGSLVIRGSGEISKFQSVKVDGVIIDAKNYTVTEGSTIITLSADYLKTLSVGSHTIELVWTDGSTSTNFNIVKNTADTGSNNTDENTQSVTSPQTGDNSNPALWTTLLLASFAGLAGMFAKRKKNDCK
nr:LPXTG cell wall anchor domain-containing protein [Roseburia sp. 831b]